MGRHRTPNEVLKKRGSKKVRSNEPEARSGSVVATRELTEEGARAFERICFELNSMGFLSPTYSEMITIAADAIGDIEIASEDLKKRGHISITERGETKNPSWTIKTSAQMAAHKYLTALGLSPTSIGKLTAIKKEDENPFADFV
jgi:P27 family predicted phage terminase small subunit